MENIKDRVDSLEPWSSLDTRMYTHCLGGGMEKHDEVQAGLEPAWVSDSVLPFAVEKW